MSDGGKGSRPRPFSVSNQEYDERWDAIFGKDKKETCKHDVWTFEGNDAVYPEKQLYKCLKCGIISNTISNPNAS